MTLYYMDSEMAVILNGLKQAKELLLREQTHIRTGKCTAYADALVRLLRKGYFIGL